MNEGAAKLLNMAGEVLIAKDGAVSPPPPKLTFPDSLELTATTDLPKVYIAGGLVQHRMLTLISGPPKARKSFLLNDLAVAIAGGGNWIGRDAERARVLLVDLELHPHYLLGRLNRIIEESGNAGARAKENLTVLPWRHVTIQNGATPARIVGAIREQAEKCNAEVICIDSVYLCLNGDESDPLAVSELLKELVKLCDKHAVVFSHHFAKGSATAQNAKSAIDRASGSSWWSRFCDVLIPLTPPVMENGDKRELLLVEPSIRHHQRVEPFSIEWKEGPKFVLLSEAQTETLQQVQKVKVNATDLRQNKHAEERASVVMDQILLLSEKTGSAPMTLIRSKCKDIATGGTLQRIIANLTKQGRIEETKDSRGRMEIRPTDHRVQMSLEDFPGVEIEIPDELKQMPDLQI